MHKYWHLTLSITPSYCKSYQKEIVISEDVLDWISRNDKHQSRFSNAVVRLYREITRDQYLKYKSTLNPRPPGKKTDRYDPPCCRSFLMHLYDYA